MFAPVGCGLWVLSQQFVCSGDAELYDHFRNAVSQLTSDEASDERRSKELVADKFDEDLVLRFA